MQGERQEGREADNSHASLGCMLCGRSGPLVLADEDWDCDEPEGGGLCAYRDRSGETWLVHEECFLFHRAITDSLAPGEDARRIVQENIDMQHDAIEQALTCVCRYCQRVGASCEVVPVSPGERYHVHLPCAREHGHAIDRGGDATMRAVHPLPSGEAETLAGQGHIKEDNRDIVRLPARSATHLSGERDERGENDRDSPSADVGLSGMHSPAWFQVECSDDAGCRAASRMNAATTVVAAMARGEGSPTDVEQSSGGVGAPPPHAGPPGVDLQEFFLSAYWASPVATSGTGLAAARSRSSRVFVLTPQLH